MSRTSRTRSRRNKRQSSQTSRSLWVIPHLSPERVREFDNLLADRLRCLSLEDHTREHRQEGSTDLRRVRGVFDGIDGRNNLRQHVSGNLVHSNFLLYSSWTASSCRRSCARYSSYSIFFLSRLSVQRRQMQVYACQSVFVMRSTTIHPRRMTSTTMGK